MIFERFSKNPQIQNLMKIRPVESRVPYGRADGHSDGQTDMMKLIVAVHSFTKRTKKYVGAIKNLSVNSNTTNSNGNSNS